MKVRVFLLAIPSIVLAILFAVIALVCIVVGVASFLFVCLVEGVAGLFEGQRKYEHPQ